MTLSLVISIWGNFTQWREHQDWEEADLKYRALKMVLPSDDPNVRYLEKNFSVCPNKEVIENVRTRVNIYEDSIRYHNEMIQMAAIKDYNAPPKTDRFGAQDSNQKTLCRHGQQLKKTTWSGVQGQGGS